MKKDYLIYISLIFLVFLAAIIIWPHYWVNIDISSFHYHKLWKGPDLTSGKYEHDFDIHLGMDFTGGVEYRLRVIFPEGEEDKKAQIEESVKLLQNRLRAVGYNESTVNWQKQEEDYSIIIQIAGSSDEFSDFESNIFQKGKLEMWGEKGEEITIENESIDLQGDETDPFRSYLEQNYTNLNVDGNRIKGFKTGETEEVSYLTIVLEDDQASELTSQIYNFYGKSLMAVLDGQLLYIDGKDLGEKLQLYREAKSVKISGIADLNQAQLFGAVIQNGPLPLDLEIVESNEFEGVYGREFLDKGMIAGLAALALLMIPLIFMFKWDGVIGVISLMLYGLFIFALLKVVPVKLTIGVVWAFIFCIGLYTGLLSLILENNKRKRREEKLLFSQFNKDKELFEIISNLITLQVIVSLVFIIFAPWQIQNTIQVILGGVVLIWIGLEYLLPFQYKLINLFKN